MSEDNTCIRDIAEEYVNAREWYLDAVHRGADVEAAEARTVLDSLRAVFPLEIMRTERALEGVGYDA